MLAPSKLTIYLRPILKASGIGVILLVFLVLISDVLLPSLVMLFDWFYGLPSILGSLMVRSLSLVSYCFIGGLAAHWLKPRHRRVDGVLVGAGAVFVAQLIAHIVRFLLVPISPPLDDIGMDVGAIIFLSPSAIIVSFFLTVLAAGIGGIGGGIWASRKQEKSR